MSDELRIYIGRIDFYGITKDEIEHHRARMN